MTEESGNKNGAGVVTRLLQGTGANALAKFYIILMQLFSIPIFVTQWGVEGYGIWLMMTSMPTYLALSDFGFAQAATADMATQLGRGRKQDVVTVFQSLLSFVLVVAVSILVLTSFFTFIGFLILDTGSWLYENLSILWLLIIFSIVSQIGRVFRAAFRSNGFYTFGTLLFETLCFMEWIVLIGSVFLGNNYFGCALIMLVGRTVNVLIMCFLLPKKVPYLKVSFENARWARLKCLWKPALSAMIIPFSTALNIQGIVLIIGSVLSPTMVATYSSVRTISRLSVQLVGLLGQASMPEISRVQGLRDKRMLSRIVRWNVMVLTAVLPVGFILFFLFGKEFVFWWTDGKVIPENLFVLAMAIGMVFQGGWMLGTQVLLAQNKHIRLSLFSLLSSGVSAFLAVPIAMNFGITGLAFLLATADFFLVLFIINQVLKSIRDV